MTDEKALIAAMQQGSETAFRYFVDAYQERVLNTCLGFVPNLEDAQDLTQETFIEIYRAIASFRGESSLSTWVYRIAVNRALQLLRRRKRKKRFGQVFSIFGEASAASLNIPDGIDHPGIALENKERGRILFAHIGRLPENQQTALIMHKVEGLQQAQIAEVMSLSIPAVEALLHRARKKLRESLADYYRQNDKGTYEL